MSHCLIVLEEIQTTLFQRKIKGIFENLQHMVACSTYYLTDVTQKSTIFHIYFNNKSM